MEYPKVLKKQADDLRKLAGLDSHDCHHSQYGEDGCDCDEESGARDADETDENLREN